MVVIYAIIESIKKQQPASPPPQATGFRLPFLVGGGIRLPGSWRAGVDARWCG